MPIGDSVMDHKELLAEAVRLATESVENGWGGPFGAVSRATAKSSPAGRTAYC